MMPDLDVDVLGPDCRHVGIAAVDRVTFMYAMTGKYCTHYCRLINSMSCEFGQGNQIGLHWNTILHVPNPNRVTV